MASSPPPSSTEESPSNNTTYTVHGIGNMPLMVRYWLLDNHAGSLDIDLGPHPGVSSSRSAGSASSSIAEAPPGSSVTLSVWSAKRSLPASLVNFDLDLLGLAGLPDTEPEGYVSCLCRSPT